MAEFVVDACSFKLFYDELIAQSNGIARENLERLLDSEVIILDARGLIRHEWTETCCGHQDEFLKEWINNRIIEDRIQERPSKKDGAIHARLLSFGVPHKDHKYIFLATTNSVRGLASDDVDMFDPKEKSRGSARVTYIKNNRLGRVCLFLRKDYSIEVFPLHLAHECI